MATAKKRKIQASEVIVNCPKLEAVLRDLAERSARAEERSARAEEVAAEAHMKAATALETIGALLQDLRANTAEMRAFNMRAEGRLNALEKAVGT